MRSDVKKYWQKLKIPPEKAKKILQEHFEKELGASWWKRTELWLRAEFGYPKTYPILETMKADYHRIFRPLLVSMFPFRSDTGGTKKLVAHSRSNKLGHFRIYPQYIGITDPGYSARSRHNFGLVQMLTEPYDIWSRAFYNIPFPTKQKLKRFTLEAYGITKHGRSLDEVNDFPKGGIFLINPDSDPAFDELTPYRDYNYVTLKVRLPRNYTEWLLTVDGSVLISHSAAKKLRYRKIAYAYIRSPSAQIAKKWLLWKKDEIQEGAHIGFQKPLSEAYIGSGEMTVGTSPVDGYVVNIEDMNPQVKNPKRKVWRITLMDERDAEIGAKIESATGLKNTIAGYVDDREPVIVINADMFKDRNLYYEVKETGNAHVFITLSGKDGNISYKGARISNTLIQGIFAYPEAIRKKIIKAIFNKSTLKFPFPIDILKKLKNLDIDPETSNEFFPYFYYIRFMKLPNGQVKPYDQPTSLNRAIQKYHQLGWEKLPRFYKQRINEFIKTITGKLLLGDRQKRCAIRLNAVQRILLWHDKEDTDVMYMGKELIEYLKYPEYVLAYKEPVSRQGNIRCYRVEHDSTLDGAPQAVRVHPYVATDYGVQASYSSKKEAFRMKLDSDGDLLVILPIKKPIDELMYHVNIRFQPEGLPRFHELKPPEQDYSPEDFLIELYEYQRYRSIESELVETFGGIKNHLMYTDIIGDTPAWNEALDQWDIELKIFQLLKTDPVLKKAPFSVINAELLKTLNEARKYMRNMEPINEVAQAWLKLPDLIDFELFHNGIIKDYIKLLHKSKHPVLKLFDQIYDTLGLARVL